MDKKFMAAEYICGSLLTASHNWISYKYGQDELIIAITELIRCIP